MPFGQLQRRDFITLLGGTTTWPIATRAQQPRIPIVAFINARSAETSVRSSAAFRKALNECGCLEGQNVIIEYDRLPSLMVHLVRRRVAVIATPSLAAGAQAAKAATSTIPIVFSVGKDPVNLALVASITRPGADATGVNIQ
jgi:putative tryptophan/tyrosine transport system substrate-binding protein